MKIIQRIFIILFCVLLALPITLTNLKPNQKSELDNTILPKFPIFNLSFPQNIQAYLKSRIGLRNQMLSLYMTIQDKFFGYLAHPFYYYGTDKEIFYQTTQAIVDFDFVDKDYLNIFSDHVKKIQNFCTQRGTEFLFTINPMKTTVYTDNLPKGINYQNLRINYLEKLIEEKHINYISMKNIMRANMKDLRVFNKKYDAGHWNDNGAFICFQSILQSLSTRFPELKQINTGEYNIVQEDRPILNQSVYTINDTTDIYTPKFMKSVNLEKYRNYLKLNDILPFYEHYINETNNDAPKVLVFAGSYYPGRSKFFADSFSETIVLTNYFNILDFDYYYNIFKPDIIVYAVAQHALQEGFFPSSQMAERKYSAVYSFFENLPEKELIVLINDKNIVSCINNIRDPITEFNSVIAGREISFAYAKIGNEFYDLKINDSGHDYVKDVILSAKTADIQNKPIDFIFISKEMDYKQTIHMIDNY